MSHIRSNLTPDEHLFQSLSVEPPTVAATPIAHPARRPTWRVVVARLRAWQANRRARRELAILDARTLRDLGIPPELVTYELAQPFWRPPRDLRS